MTISARLLGIGARDRRPHELGCDRMDDAVDGGRFHDRRARSAASIAHLPPAGRTRSAAAHSFTSCANEPRRHRPRAPTWCASGDLLVGIDLFEQRLASADDGSSASAFCACGARVGRVLQLADTPRPAPRAPARCRGSRSRSSARRSLPAGGRRADGCGRSAGAPPPRRARGTRRGAVRPSPRDPAPLEQPAAAIEMELRQRPAGRAARC